MNGQEVQGFNFIVPINTAAEFVRQAGTEYLASPIDKLWRTGLEHYWKAEYSRAKESFQGVTALFSDHSEATKLITEAQERLAKGEDRSGRWDFKVEGPLALLIIGGGLMVPVIGIGGLVFLIRRSAKQRQTPLPSASQPQTAKAPVPVPAPQPVAAGVAFAPKTESFAPVVATD